VTATLVGHLSCLLLGIGVGLGSTTVHRLSVLGLPLGLVLAVGATLVTAWHLRGGAAPRRVCSYCLGWVAVLGLALRGRPEGDFAIAGDLAGYTLMVAGLLLVALGVASLTARVVHGSP
jgi:hypothetical protein